jgi:predicted patatin/cPLA2 family phospholipase
MEDSMDEVGQVREILRDLHYDEVLGKNGKKRRRILAGNPGGKSGVQSAAELHAFQDRGIHPQRFDAVYGNSASSWNKTAYCARMADRARSVYEELCDMPFLFPQWWRGAWWDYRWMFGDWMNLQDLHDLLARHGLDDVPRNDWPELLIGVSDLTGKHHFLRGKEQGSVLQRCRASSSLLPFTAGVAIGGRVWVDGGHAHPCPIREMVRDAYEAGEEVDVLILANRPHPRHMSAAERMVFHSMALSWLPLYSWQLCASTRSFDEKMERLTRMAIRPRDWIRIGILFPEPQDATLQFEWRKDVVRENGHRAYWQTDRLVARCQPARQI